MKRRAALFGLLCAAGLCRGEPAAERGAKLLPGLDPGASIPTYHALIVGINEYRHWPDLRQARGDAEQLARVLTRSYGFDATRVRVLLDERATRQALLDALYDLCARLGPSDALLIYYAGHGFYDRQMDNGYWIPAEGREPARGRPVVADWVQDVQIKDMLAKTKARQVLVLSDACFSGALFRGGPEELGSRDNAYYRAAIAQPTRWCITSGDLEQVPDESVFSRKILEALQYPRQPVFAGSDLAGWIKKDVAAFTGGQPRFGPLRTIAGAEGGEFVFVCRADITPPALPAAPRPGVPHALDLGRGRRMELLWIPPGDVQLGSSEAERAWAVGAEGKGKPEWFRGEGAGPRPASIRDGFWLGRTEVTVGQWRPFVEATSHVTDAEKRREAWCLDWKANEWRCVKGKSWRDPNYGFPIQDSYPVTCVSWNDAMAYGRWLSERERAAGRLPPEWAYRLPTEAEWEYACRGGASATRFWWGDTVAEGRGRLNGASDDPLGPRVNGTWSRTFPWSDGFAWVSPVDQFGPRGRNSFGLADMLGNVWEWCLDGYDPGGAHPSLYLGDTSARVLRGGSFLSGPGYARCACRDRNAPSGPDSSNNGFRVCLGVAIGRE